MSNRKSNRAASFGRTMLNLMTFLAIVSFVVGCDADQPKPVKQAQSGDFRYAAGGELAQKIVYGIQLDGCCGDMHGEE